LADECRRVGNDFGARHNATLADIYNSLFNIQQTA
jgi:hypothetical protein